MVASLWVDSGEIEGVKLKSNGQRSEAGKGWKECSEDAQGRINDTD